MEKPRNSLGVFDDKSLLEDVCGECGKVYPMSLGDDELVQCEYFWMMRGGFKVPTMGRGFCRYSMKKERWVHRCTACPCRCKGKAGKPLNKDPKLASVAPPLGEGTKHLLRHDVQSWSHFKVKPGERRSSFFLSKGSVVASTGKIKISRRRTFVQVKQDAWVGWVCVGDLERVTPKPGENDPQE